MRLNAFFSKNYVAKTRYCALKTRFKHITSFNAKHWETYKRIELCKSRLTSAKTSLSLRLNRFFRKTTLNALKRVLSR